MHFYDVRGSLVRRWVPAGRRKALEVWNGGDWSLYPELDDLLRHGVRLTEDAALALLQATRERAGHFSRFSEDEARAVLRGRLRRPAREQG